MLCQREKDEMMLLKSYYSSKDALKSLPGFSYLISGETRSEAPGSFTNISYFGFQRILPSFSIFHFWFEIKNKPSNPAKKEWTFFTNCFHTSESMHRNTYGHRQVDMSPSLRGLGVLHLSGDKHPIHIRCRLPLLLWVVALVSDRSHNLP